MCCQVLFTLTPRRGTHEQALQYVTKQESRINGPWFYGEPVKQGTRTDLHEMYTAVKERKTNAEILEASEGAAAKFEKAIRFMRFTVGEQERVTGNCKVCACFACMDPLALARRMQLLI